MIKYEHFSADRLLHIVELGIEMQRESDFQDIPMNIEKTATSIMGMVVNNPNGFGMLAYEDGRAIGMIAGSITPYFFSRGKMASDFVWFVRPERRGGRTALRLLTKFVDWAKENGATALYMGISTNVETARTGDLLCRLGFDHVGGNYRKLLHEKL